MPLSTSDRERAISDMDRFLADTRDNAELQQIDVSALRDRRLWFRVVVTDDWRAQIQYRMEDAGLDEIQLTSTAPNLVAELLSGGVSQALDA